MLNQEIQFIQIWSKCDEDKAQSCFLSKSQMMLFSFKIPLPMQVFSSSPSSRPSGQRQKIFFIVKRQICEQFPLLLAHSPASSQVRPSSDNLVLGRFSQEHSKLPQVLRQTSWHSPRPLFLEHSLMSVSRFPTDRRRKVFHKMYKKRDEKLLLTYLGGKLVRFSRRFFFAFYKNMN